VIIHGCIDMHGTLALNVKKQGRILQELDKATWASAYEASVLQSLGGYNYMSMLLSLFQAANSSNMVGHACNPSRW
jgi:hypothetical protein